MRSVASSLKISPVYLSDIEKGKRYAPVKGDILSSLIKILNIPEDQISSFYDMAYASRGFYVNIKEYLNENAKAREFLRKAKEMNISDEDWNMLLNDLDAISQKTYKLKFGIDK